MDLRPARLPQELFDIIVDCLKNDPHVLRRLALVSKAWHARTNVWLYHTVQVIDDDVGDFRYVCEGAPYPTLRMRNLGPFLSREASKGRWNVLRHVRCLRIACFRYEDEESWFEYLSTWMLIQIPSVLAVQRLQVFLNSRPDVGPLLRALALHFHNVHALDVYGSFVDGPQMAECLSSFIHVTGLRFYGPQYLHGHAIDALLQAAPPTDTWLPVPYRSCVLRVDTNMLRLMLKWFEKKLKIIRTIVVENVQPALRDSANAGLVYALRTLSEDERNLIEGIHIDATRMFLTTASSLNIQLALQLCPHITLFHATISYLTYKQIISNSGSSAACRDFDPIFHIALLFNKWLVDGMQEEPMSCPSLRVLLIEVMIEEEDISSLWYLHWTALDRVLSHRKWDHLEKVIISLCVIGSPCDSTQRQHKSADRFFRSCLSSCRCLETRYRGLPPRTPARKWQDKTLQRPRDEDEFIRFARSDFL